MKPSLPDLCKLADAASGTAQKTYLGLSIAQLCFLAFSALVAGITPSEELHRHTLSWAVCILIAVALLCATALRLGKFDVRWFKCRAFAENAKSLAWRYVMTDRDDCNSGREAYLLEWSQLKERIPELQNEFALAADSGELITQWMIDTSKLLVEEKLAIYRNYRVHDQIKWYAHNAKRNARKQSQWFWALFLFEAAAVFYAAIQASLLWRVNLVGFLVAVSAGIVAWSQVKRHSDLSTSYAIAAEDLSLISEKFKSITEHRTVGAFVENVEEAVSREHSMWLARRNC
jgi:hypothetical protein